MTGCAIIKLAKRTQTFGGTKTRNIMKLNTALALGGLTCSVLSLLSESSTPGVLSLPFERRAHQIQRRDTTLEVATGSLVFNNIVNITVGTPPQPITLTLDTGSSDTILLNQQSPLCKQYEPWCPSVGYCKSHVPLQDRKLKGRQIMQINHLHINISIAASPLRSASSKTELEAEQWEMLLQTP